MQNYFDENANFHTEYSAVPMSYTTPKTAETVFIKVLVEDAIRFIKSDNVTPGVVIRFAEACERALNEREQQFKIEQAKQFLRDSGYVIYKDESLDPNNTGY